jgi:secondary thiamine-phosphate synthase enzyme
MSVMPILKEIISTASRNEMIDITERVQKAVTAAKLESGVVVVYVPHTTAGVTINENADPNVQHDLLKKLAELVPKHESYYRHDEGNSDSHVKTACVGNSSTVFVEEGRLLLGRWQGIYLCEFDGPRQRQIWIKTQE